MRALLIPADDAGPIAEVEIGGAAGAYDDLKRLVAGPIQTVPFPGRDDIAPYCNEEGKLKGLPANRRATRLLRDSIFPDDYIAGDCVLAGFEPETGATVELPADFEIPAPRPGRLDEPSAIERKDRSTTYEWLLSEDADGKRRLATLSVSHHRAGTGMFSGESHPNEFTATLQHETEEPRDGYVSRCFTMFSGIGIVREQVARFSAKGLDAFAERSLERLRELVEAGDERVLRYFERERAEVAR